MMNRRGRDGSVYWRCTRSRNSHCTGTITTDIDDRLVFITNTHNHPRDDSAIVAKKLVNDLKSKTQDNIRPVPQLYLEELQRVAALPNADEIAANLAACSSLKMRTSLYTFGCAFPTTFLSFECHPSMWLLVRQSPRSWTFHDAAE